MRNQPIKVLHLNTGFFHRFFCRVNHCTNCKFKHFTAIHPQGLRNTRNPFIHFLLVFQNVQQRNRMTKFPIRTKMMSHKSIVLFCRLHHCCACTITKQNTGLAVFPVRRFGQGFRTNYQNILIFSAFHKAICNIQSCQKSGTCCINIQTVRVFCTNFFLHQARHMRR